MASFVIRIVNYNITSINLTFHLKAVIKSIYYLLFVNCKIRLQFVILPNIRSLFAIL